MRPQILLSTTHYQTRKRRNLIFLRILILMSILLFWEFAAGRVIDAIWMGKPSGIFIQMWGWFATGFIFPHLATTFGEMILGLSIGIPIGIAFGVVFGSSRLISQAANPIIMAVYSTPHIALVPLLIIWFGVGMPSKVALVFLTVFFLMFFNTYAGVRNTDQDLIQVFSLLGASRWEIFTKLVIPHAAVWMMTGVRMSIPLSLVSAAGGEIIVSQRGLGFLLAKAAEALNPDSLFAALFLMMFLGILTNELAVRIEARVLVWKQTDNSQE